MFSFIVDMIRPVALSTIALAAVGEVRPPRAPAQTIITASDYAFEAPDSIRAGLVSFRLLNQGLSAHQVVLLRLERGRTMRELERELITSGRLPGWAVDVGGPGATIPGGSTEVIVPVEPGRHVILCASRTSDGTLALMRGMYRALEVVGPAVSAPAAESNTTVTVTSEGMTLRGALRSGPSRLRVRNTASASREVRIYPVQGAEGERRLRLWLDTERGAPPTQPVGGVTALPPGGWAVLGVSLQRGEYALVSRAPALRRPAFGPSKVVVQRVRVP